MYLFNAHFIYLSAHLSISFLFVFIHLFIHLFTHLSMYSSIHSSIFYLSFYLSTYLSSYLSFYLFVHMLNHLFIDLGSGLSSAQKKICNGFLYLPQYGIGGTGSLNVSVATTLVLHRFTIWQAEDSRNNTEIEKSKFLS